MKKIIQYLFAFTLVATNVASVVSCKKYSYKQQEDDLEIEEGMEQRSKILESIKSELTKNEANPNAEGYSILQPDNVGYGDFNTLNDILKNFIDQDITASEFKENLEKYLLTKKINPALTKISAKNAMLVNIKMYQNNLPSLQDLRSNIHEALSAIEETVSESSLQQLKNYLDKTGQRKDISDEQMATWARNVLVGINNIKTQISDLVVYKMKYKIDLSVVFRLKSMHLTQDMVFYFTNNEKLLNDLITFLTEHIVGLIGLQAKDYHISNFDDADAFSEKWLKKFYRNTFLSATLIEKFKQLFKYDVHLTDKGMKTQSKQVTNTLKNGSFSYSNWYDDYVRQCNIVSKTPSTERETSDGSCLYDNFIRPKTVEILNNEYKEHIVREDQDISNNRFLFHHFDVTFTDFTLFDINLNNITINDVKLKWRIFDMVKPLKELSEFTNYFFKSIDLIYRDEISKNYTWVFGIPNKPNLFVFDNDDITTIKNRLNQEIMINWFIKTKMAEKYPSIVYPYSQYPHRINPNLIFKIDKISDIILPKNRNDSKITAKVDITFSYKFYSFKIVDQIINFIQQ